MQNQTSKNINKLVINTKTRQYLSRIGFASINDLADYANRTGEIPKTRGYGAKTLQDVQFLLQQHNLTNNIHQKHRFADSYHEKLLKKITKKRALHQINEQKKPEPTVLKEKSSEETLDDKVSMPCYIIQSAIRQSLEERDLKIFFSISKLIIPQKNQTLRQVGEEIGISGERIRQLLKKVDKRVNLIIRKQIRKDPHLFKKSFYNELYWSNHFFINDEIISKMNLYESVSFSLTYYEHLFSIIFDKHNSFNISNKSVVFINKRLLRNQEFKKTVSSFIKNNNPEKLLTSIYDRQNEIIIEQIISEKQKNNS